MQADQLGPIRLAFIGGFGHHYLRGALADADLPIEAVAVASDGIDSDATRKRFEAVLPQAAWYDNPTELFEQFRPTVISVGGVYAHNGKISLNALQRGIAVVSEKPIAASWQVLSELNAECQRDNAILLSEFNFRSHPAFRAARKAIQDGLIGDVVLATAQKSYRFGDARPGFYRNREDYGSTMLWVASHAIDAIRFATELRYTQVCANHANLTKQSYCTMEDHCAAMFRLSNGATAMVHADFLRPEAAASHGDDRLRIAGANGVLEIREGRCLLTTHAEAEQDITDTVQPLPIHRELLNAVARGGDDLYSTAESLAVAATLLAARDAADQQSIRDI